MNETSRSETSIATKTMIFFAVLVAVLFVIHYSCNRYTKYWGKVVGSAIERDMCSELFNHYQKQSYRFFDENNTGKLTSAITIDIKNISTFLYFAPETILDFTVRLIGAFTVFFIVNIWFGFVAVTVLGLAFLYTCYFVPKIQRKMIASHENFSDLNSITEEALSGIRTVQSFANEELELNKFCKLNEQYFENQKVIHRLGSVLNSGMNSFIITLIPIITIISMFFVINGMISTGDLITYLLYVDILIGPLFTFIGLIQNYQESIAGYRRFFDLLTVEPEISDSKDSIKLDNIKGSVEFRNVSFYYSKEKKNIFNNLNLKIESGEYIALVGASGVGKSTLCNLIPRFYDVLDGEILVDNINIKNIILKNLRENIGFVQQDTFLFSGTVMENIRYGKPKSSDEEIFEAAKSAYAHDFIMGFTDGYHTQIGQRGLKLSGGQRQRIAIARVFLKDPPILVFDEATSSLDSESERYIQKSLEKLTRDRTTIVIAHRLSTIKNAKRILVLTNEGIVEEGTHEELLDNNGVYTGFYRLI